MRSGFPAAALVLCLLLCRGISPAETPYKRMHDEPVRFTGADPARPEADHRQIMIGLFLPRGDKDRAAQAVADGARLAVAEANAGGGYAGVPFGLIRRWDDNPWAGGSSEMVKLVYEDHAVAVIVHGNGAGHIAEQVAAKAFVPVVTPVSADPSLTQTRIPWIFRLPPDITVQARLLIEQGLKPRRLARVGIISATDHDGRIAGAAFAREMERARLLPVFHLQLQADGKIGRKDIAYIRSFSPDGLMVHLPDAHLIDLLSGLTAAGIACPVFLPWIPSVAAADLPGAYGGSIIVSEPFSPSKAGADFDKFVSDYTRSYGFPPSAAAAYGFDAAMLIIEAVKSVGPGRSKVRESLATSVGRNRVTGRIRWDNGGGNTESPALREVAGRAGMRKE